MKDYIVELALSTSDELKYFLDTKDYGPEKIEQYIHAMRIFNYALDQFENSTVFGMNYFREAIGGDSKANKVITNLGNTHYFLYSLLCQVKGEDVLGNLNLLDGFEGLVNTEERAAIRAFVEFGGIEEMMELSKKAIQRISPKPAEPDKLLPDVEIITPVEKPVRKPSANKR